MAACHSMTRLRRTCPRCVRAGGPPATVRDLLADRSGLPLSSALEFGFDDHPDEDDGADAPLRRGSGGRARDRLLVVHERGLVPARPVDRDNDGRDVGRRHAALPLRSDGDEPDDVRRGVGSERRVSGYEVTPGGPVRVESPVGRAYGPAGTTIVSTVPDLLRFAALHLRDSSLAALRVAHSKLSIYGWLDSWCLGWARYDWDGRQVWGWDGLIGGGDPSCDPAGGPGRHRRDGERQRGAGDGALLFADLLPRVFGINVPPLRLEPAPVGAADLPRFAGVYAWPDRQVEVTATSSGLQIKRAQGQVEARPLDDRVFLVDPSDPDNPTVTFGEFDAAGRPRVLYLMLWGLPRVDG